MAHHTHRDPPQNHHHVWFERRDYDSNSSLHKLRNRAGFLILMNMQDHRDMHHTLLRGVPRPDRLASEELLRTLPDKEEGQSRIHQLEFAIGHFLMHGQDLTAEHLQEQVLYITRHPVIIGGVEHE